MYEFTGCDDDWAEVDGKCIQLSSDKAGSQDVAFNKCKQAGGQLYQPTNKEEEKKVYDWIQKNDGSSGFFIGLRSRYTIGTYALNFWPFQKDHHKKYESVTFFTTYNLI